MTEINNRSLFLVFMLLLGAHLCVYAMIRSLIQEDMIYDELIRHFDQQKTADILQRRLEHFPVFAYTTKLLGVVGRVLLVSFCFLVGSQLIEMNLGVKRVLLLVLFADFVLLLQPVAKLVWFQFINTRYELNDLSEYSFSLLSLTDFRRAEWFAYPLELINFFEVAYWLVLTWQLGQIVGLSFRSSFAFVASTYGTGLLLWVIFVVLPKLVGTYSPDPFEAVNVIEGGPMVQNGSLTIVRCGMME